MIAARPMILSFTRWTPSMTASERTMERSSDDETTRQSQPMLVKGPTELSCTVDLIPMTAGPWTTLRTILVYPSSYLAKHPHDEKKKHHRLGESWQFGPVVLAWDSSRRGGKNAFDGHNVVMHEFAHQLDQIDGAADGAPTLGQGEERGQRRQLYRSWALVFSRDFECLQKKAAKGKRTVIDHYGATNPAEFFATATEAFFEKPRQLKKKRPELYEELRAYYRQNPVAWHGSRDC